MHRHTPLPSFADREALESALATLGLRELKADLDGGRGLPTTGAELADVGYVEFARRRPDCFG